MDAIYTFFLLGGSLMVLSILASRLSSLFGVPLLLIFLGLGMLAGEEGILGIVFDDYGMAFAIGHLALAMILLDGGLRTRLKTFRVGFKPALSLATLGVFLTSGFVGIIAMWIFDLTLVQGLLVGAIVGSTDAAAVFSMLSGRGVNLNERVGATLEIESGTNDPMAIFLTLMLIELVTGDLGGWWETLVFLVSQFGIGLAVGIGGGWLSAKLLRWLDLAPGLYSMLALALGFSVFGVTSVLGGSGFLAIYLTGLMIGNQPGRHLNFILPVHDGLAWLSQIGLFLVLGLLVTPSELWDVALPASIVALALIFLARPLAVLITIKPFFKFRWRETLFIAWVGLRGAVPIVLAIFPVIFANGMSPGSGPGLIFMSLPLAFQAMPLGTLFGILFFVMLSMAALTSSISMVEATVSWLCDNKGISRRTASWGTGIVLWLVSTLAMLSFNVGADWTLAGKHVFDWLDYLTSRWMMPLGGLGMVMLAGFVLNSQAMRDELGLSAGWHALWLFMVRYVSPLGILVIFVDALGIAQVAFAQHWPWLLGLLMAITLIGEWASPRLRRVILS